jgi:hydroxypyruvate reductase
MQAESALSRARSDLPGVLSAATARVAGDAAVRHWLGAHASGEECALVAIGKAAASMLRGARDMLGGRVADALLITGRDYLDKVPAGVGWAEGAHPLPDARSLAAGQALLAFVAGQPAGRRLLFLISGGASAMVEVLHDGVDADLLARANRWLLGSGLSIVEMNAVRTALSRIKGGGLLDYLGSRPATALLISDVPGDDPAVIGSGLLVPSRVAADVLAGLALPPWLRAVLGPVRPKPASSPVQCVLVATNRDAREAAAEAGCRLGYATFVHETLVTGDAAGAGERLARTLLSGPPGIHVWGGETTVRLPARPGRGGRNQHLALAAARVFEDRPGILLLSAGTDGRDGPGEDAGAMVDGGTLARGRLGGLDPDDALRRADSGRFLESAGDLLNTGPTGTNVMDLVIGWKSR